METHAAVVIAQQDNPYILEIQHLGKCFENNQVLVDVNLQIKKGENLVALGKSGSGKSVLIKCIVRLIEPDQGKIVVFGADIFSLPNHELNKVRKKIGFLFQSAALYDSMTVRENLEFPLRRQNRKIKKRELDPLVMETLQNVGLEKAVDLMPSELSGGMRKRIGLARTLILKPELILYDEPTTGLDPVTSREISQLILEIQRKNNASSVIITHDLDCAKITSNRIVVLKEGIIAAEGTYPELEQSEDAWVRSFFDRV